MKENKVKAPERATTGCTILMDPALRDKVQKVANKNYLSRGAQMRMWIVEGLERELKKGKN